MTTVATTPLDAAYSAVLDALGPFAEAKELLVGAKVRALMAGYDKIHADNPYKPIGVENTVLAPLINPETRRSSRTFSLAGKLDVIANYRGRRVIIDHKTTSDDISDPSSPYWRQLTVESQASHYLLLEWLNGRKCDAALWDVLRKPTIGPKKLAKAMRASIVESGMYCGGVVSEADRKALADGEERETISMFELRLLEDCIDIRPERYFQRRPVPRMDSELEDHAKDLWSWGQEMLWARKHKRHPTTSSSCMLYGRPCQFLGVCSGHDDIESDQWKSKENVHVELPELEGDGKDVLTNSRIRCFQSCRRKHYYQYELGLTPNKDEESDALYFGNLWHVAQEAWWKSQMED